MNCHQILSGACNAGDRCYAVGSVEGISFTAYAAGCNIVILANNFERVQIIPGAVHNYIRISCLDCSTDTGKIAAAYENQVCIFEPTPLIHSTCSHQLEYRWVQTGSLQTESNITSLSWNLEGTRLLTGGELLQLWHQNIMPYQEEHTTLPTTTKPKTLQTEEVSTTGNNHNVTANTSQDPTTVTFSIGGEAESPGPGDTSIANDPGGWNCVWKCRTATPVHLMSFSPDGTLFATTGMNDRLVKIWFENKSLFPAKSIDHTSFSQSVGSDNFSFVYVAHPRAITHLSWRKTSKYMPKGSVSNMLVTSCRDNICRVWAETIPPEIEGLANMSQFEGSDRHGHHGKHRHHNMHKHRFMQRLKHMKTCFHIRRHAKQQHQAGHAAPTLPTLPSTYSVHDFHNNYQTSGHYPGMHFHLAASINAETDIPLVPSLITGDPEREPNFILHWLNNKEMHFTMQAENILQELTRKVVEKEEGLQHQDAEHVEHDSEDECTPKKGVRLQTTQKPVVGGRSMSQEEHSSDEHHTAHTTSSHHSLAHSVHSHPTLSNTTSINSIATDATSTMNHAPDSLDTKIETLLRDWHHNPDLLFSIHPIDGSFLIWHIEWLDEYHPGSFRQAQISFSTRIPNAFPLGDASTMSHNVSMYSHNTGGPLLNIREVAKSSTKSSDPNEVATPLPSLIEQDEEQSTLTSKAGQELLKNMENTNDQNQAKVESSALESNKNGQDADLLAHPSPIVSMVSKHSNGTLNLWQLTFADKTKFSQVLSIGHACRASGHRFRVNDITCHPVLPLLVTTSHHNIPEFSGTQSTGSNENLDIKHSCKDRDIISPTGFCSELILWRVDAVGPLSKSGGVSELARINSPEISAFSNVAWIPTLLPSTTLGNLSNSPSACFVASDGECLRVYQAVIDARTLLAEVSISERRSRMMDSMASLSTDMSSDDGVRHSIHDRIKIVSQQSTARPGCVIQLDAISDATHDWQNTQFLHVFQEQLITGERSDEKLPGIDTSANDLGLMESTLDAMVDLQQSAIFEEPFYIVVLERTQQGTTVHMWRLVIASQPETAGLSGSMMYVPDSHLVQDEDDEGTPGRLSHAEGKRSRRASQTGGRSRRDSQADLDSTFLPRRHQNSHVLITTTKVCTQELPLPDGVEVIHAAPAAGHLSSSSIYPACFAPYIIVTACSDSTVRFWKCKVTKRPDDKLDYEWCEWEMTRKDQESTIDITGQPLNISAAYSGRIACAYKYGKSFTRPTKNDPDSRYVNLCVAIYECESTGGSEWILEDTIHLKNIHLPRIPVDQHLDLSYLYDSRFLQKKQRLTQVLQTLSHEDVRSSRNGENGDSTKANAGLLAVPSFSTLQSLRKSIIENGNTCPLTQKHLVQLDWVSKEDGSHILTVGVGSKIMLFTPVCSDLAQANMKAMKESQSNNRPILRKTSSLAQPQFVDEIRWMKLRKIELTTADGLPPLPMQISWVRDGILVVGMDSEMHVYSQWKPNPKNDCFHSNLQHQESDEFQASRNLRDEDLRTLAHETSQRRLANVSSMPHLSRVSSINLTMLDAKKKRGIQNENLSFDYMPDYGLFEASRIACPVLPQYHPKQLMELLNSGKIRWVKAILAHLVRCIGSSCSLRADDENLVKQRGWSRSRTMSVSYMGTTSPLEPRGSTTQIPEELTLDYAEITSISPLPLWTLLMADKETNIPHQQNEDKHDYNELFDSNLDEGESLDDMLDEDYECSRQKDRRSSVPERQGISHFGPRQGRLLSRLLTHTHLPGLSSLDQMHLLALADTVSTCNVDFAERFAIDAAKNAIAKENLTGIPDGETVSTDSLDDCGLRFLLAMKHYNYLIRCLPLVQRAQFQKQGIASNNLVWAFHSESEEELLGLIPSYAKDQPKWSVLKELGVGWWIRSNTVLKKCVEKIAKAAFQDKQDPLDAAVYYLAMKKKNLVWGLFRNKRDERMTTFFSNNFTENRWRKAALKNAFALLGKQRFGHAAAFFLLAGALKDAIDVCLNKLNDIQLAMVIARLYENDTSSPNMRRLLYEEILGCDKDGQNQDMSRVHPDPFLRSMALWILKDYSGSLNTLLLTNVGNMHPQYNDESDKPEGTTANPNVFNFYVYLRTHPLLIRQYIASTAQDKKKGHSVVISGFSYGTETKSQPDKQLLLEDSITPLERQLYFTTAHAHFKAGCPALALEVLSKLPNKVMETNGEDSPSLLNSPSKVRAQDSQIDTGIINWGNESNALNSNKETAGDADWGSSSFDWSPSSKRMDEDKLELNWDDETGEGEDADSPPMSMKLDKKEQDDAHKLEDDVAKSAGQLDIMAQQLKFVACLKILMEELSTLATGFEVDGGQLRYQLYVWLEREVDALRQLCSYSVSADGDVNNVTEYEGGMVDDVPPYKPGEQPTLHQILVAEKLDFEAKVQRAAKRKKWLKANETLLRTLLSYCSLHGASGGGLASVRMELVLLLQELQQEKTQQQLLSPLPFPTTLPLLSASVACNKTVVADPVRHLQSLAHDMLQTLVELRNPPMPNRNTHYCEVFIMRDLAVALSACIYQSLCDSDTFVMKHHQPDSFPAVAEVETFSGGHLVASNRYHRRYSTDDGVCITTSPSKWPGVTNLRALLAREKDEDTPKLNILLCEAFVATYMSLFIYALSSCDSHILYRLVGQHFDNNTWASLFGGGVKKLLRVASTTSQGGNTNSVERTDSMASEIQSTASGMWNTMTSLTKQRVKLNMKLLGQFTGQQPNMKEDKPTYREQFVSPQMSMISYFLIKPRIETEYADEIDYDSSDSAVSDLDSTDDEEDVFDTGSKPKNKPKDNTEHSNSNSYSWSVMRLAIVKILQQQLQDFLTIAGIEMQELPVSSPLTHGTLGIVAQWQESLREELELKGPPPANYIPGCAPDPSPTPGKPAIHKYRSLLEKGNTPFNTRLASSASTNRLWCYLVRQEMVQDIFIRAVFGKRRSLSTILESSQSVVDSVHRGTGEDKGSDSGTTSLPEPVRIIHKEQDSISAFCLNQVNPGLMALATPREVQEMNISLLLELPSWLEDECEFDIINLNKQLDPEPIPPTSFLVIQTAADRPLLAQSPQQNNLQPHSGIASQSGRGASVMKGMPAFPGSHDLRFCQFVADRSKHLLKPILKHKIDGIRRISSHPLLPLYLTGSQDGSVSLWEWGHQTAVATPRAPGTFAKVTRVRFSQHGNKFGVADSDGHLSLFQVACREGTARPFFTYQCHSKVTSDFVFLGACSLVATAGHGSEGRNVALWDTLLPQNKSLVQGFMCHDQGASALILAPQHQLLISGGKKGDINIFDVRQRQQRQRFQAHESAIKCLALDPHEEFFVSGAGDGDIKIWGLTVHSLLYSFPSEHPRSSFFKNIGQGVTQLHVDSAGRLFSCGADGSMKVRQLPERDCVIQTLY